MTVLTHKTDRCAIKGTGDAAFLKSDPLLSPRFSPKVLVLSFLKVVIYFIYFWLCWGLCCCVQTFSSCKFLTTVASLVVEHRLICPVAYRIFPDQG